MTHLIDNIVTINKREAVSKLFSPQSITEYHRVFLLIISNLKTPLCYSVSSVVSYDTPTFISTF